MTNRHLVKRIVMIGVLILFFAVAFSYAGSVALGETELGIAPALAFVLMSLPTIVPILVIIGAIPVLVTLVTMSAKRRRRDQEGEDHSQSD